LIEDDNDESDDGDDETIKGPTMKAIPPDKRSGGVINDVDIENVDEDEEDYLKDDEPDVSVKSDLRANDERTNANVPSRKTTGCEDQ
jgi:hypothetical protein